MNEKYTDTSEKTVLRKLSLFKRQFYGFLFAVPFLVIFALFFIFPFFSGIAQSFVNRKGEFVGLQNYRNILFSQDFTYRADFFRGLKNTLTFVVFAVPLLIVIPLFIAVLIDIQPKGYKFFRALLFMPTVFSISSVILMWKRVLEVETGFINGIFKFFNMNQINFLGSQPWAWISLLVVTIWWTMGTNIVILGAGLKNIDKAVYEAAAIDGASYIKTVFSITLPLLVGQIIVVFIMTLLASFNVYGQPALLTVGGPERSTQVLLMVILDNLFDRPYVASAMSLMLGAIMIVISLAQAAIARKRRD
ncbi:MAG: carbohydrate ABC transporter permease [Coriobacteriales bacterium]|jgi:binding-protein-dependent transport system inner membrane component|nr:MAG: ABC transporter permease [Clostridiales bacterium]